ncbi:MAG: cation-translocating P-type ATPase [Bacilli bacterium]|nr:cation-translocating P-type ATPase [Bacilli bacterium]
MDNLTGLTRKEVEIRKEKNLVNYDTTVPTKSIKQIIKSNIFTLFNFLNFTLAIALILVKSYKNMLFLGVVFCNTIISIIQEINAKRTIDKLSIISATKSRVLRDGKLEEIENSEIVLDDILYLSLGNQVVTDSIIVKGTVEVNEAFITGESVPISKKAGDELLSGSFIVSGNAYVKVLHIGIDNYTAKISAEAHYIKQVNSILMKSLKKIIKMVSISIIPIGLILFARQLGIEDNTFNDAVVNTVAAILGMIPEGLVLLTSTVLAVSIIRLSKYKVLVQDLYCIETLARVDMLCLDKTGTITEGNMEVYATVPYGNIKTEEVGEILSSITNVLDDSNPTFHALKNKYHKKTNWKVKTKIPFSSEKKYSGVEFETQGTYLLGAPECLLKERYVEMEQEIKQYILENRVLLLIHTDSWNGELPKKYEFISLILIRDKIRAEARETLKYFKEQGVSIKVISGDNVITVSSIAKRAGIENYCKMVDMSTIKTKDELYQAAKNYTIFGRVSPIQKKELIMALKEQGHIVAMTGDGVNDVLALKEADCSIAMSSGTDAARNVSELVLLNSNFDAMPAIVAEGRRTVNNIERSATLFLTKTTYATVLAVTFAILGLQYPFIPIQLTLTSVVTIGIPSFVLALGPNKNRIKGNFLKNVFSKSIPSALTIVFNILLIMLASKLFPFTDEQVSTMCVFMNGFVGFRLLYQLCKPFNFLKKALFVSMITLMILQCIFLREFYSLVWLNVKMIILLGGLMIVSLFGFRLFTDFIEWRMKWKEKKLY